MPEVSNLLGIIPKLSIKSCNIPIKSYTGPQGLPRQYELLPDLRLLFTL